MRVGLIVMDENPATAIAVARAADAAGVDSVWSIDYYNQSSLTRAAAFAAATAGVGVGTSVTPLFARAPIALAAAARDIQLISGGRFVLGVGTSTRRMNKDWYGVELDHPAPRLEERIRLVRSLMEHESGPFEFHGRFDHVTMAHYEGHARSAFPIRIMAAGVGEWMLRAVARSADGVFGHTVASAEILSEDVRPLIERCRVGRDRLANTFTYSSQIVASVDPDRATARRRAAQQVGFYSTPRGYDALFPKPADEASRVRARKAFQSGDLDGLAAAGDQLVSERAVFGTATEVNEQLRRYSDVLDLALLYPPTFGVDAADVTRNEYALIEIAASWAA